MNEKQCIIFTDLKDFTYKNSLLTAHQISEILLHFEKIVRETAEKYGIHLVKNIGDAYFWICTEIETSLQFAQEISTLAEAYDATQRIDLKKISLRITLTYGVITASPLHHGEDYFGEMINLWARIMDITPAGHIFCTKEIYEANKKFSWEYLWSFEFYGFLEKIPLYSLKALTENERKELHSTEDSRLESCENIIFRASCVAAILTAQPIPFLENLNIIAVHLYMLIHIAAKFEKNLTVKEAGKIFMTIVASLWISYITLQWAGTALKILLPGIGGYMYIPMSFWLSYALWKIYVLYFYYERSWESLTIEQTREYFSKHKMDGVKIAKKQKKEILTQGKKYMNEILHMFQGEELDSVQKDTIRMLQKHS